MKLTIIPSDKAVYKDGVMRAQVPNDLDLTSCNIPSNVHALQWEETKGWIEFEKGSDDITLPNEMITALPEWAVACLAVYDAWTPYVAPVEEQPTNTP